MQKLLTVTINIEKLQGAASGPFAITELEGVNALLHEGWTVQKWEFITNEDEDKKAVVLLILDDEMGDHEFDVTAYGVSGDAEEEEDLDPNDDGDENEAPDTDNEDHEEDAIAVPYRTTASLTYLTFQENEHRN